jgi:hypothetical protein
MIRVELRGRAADLFRFEAAQQRRPTNRSLHDHNDSAMQSLQG